MCEAHGLEVPALDDGTRAAIDELLASYGTSRNPVDVTAQGSVPVRAARTAGDAGSRVAKGDATQSVQIEQPVEQLLAMGLVEVV